MPKYISKLQDKRVLVIGGTSGIGFCVAEAAAEHGAIVFVASSQQTKIDKTIERIQKSVPNAKISGFACDLANPDTSEGNIIKLLEFATQDGKLDHVVKTAGDALSLPPLPTVTAEAYFKAQQVRFVGSLYLAKHITKYMNISNASSLTLTGGVNTSKPAAGWSVLAASGGSSEGLTRGLAVELKPLRVNMVAPGAIITELWENSFQAAGAVDKVKERFAAMTLTGEVGQPEDTAEAYIYLMKDKFVVGQIILTEGGYLLV